MDVRRVRVCLWSVSAVGAVGSLLALTWGLAWPHGTQPPLGGPATQPVTAASQRPEADLPALSAYVPLWSLPLRRPLFDPPPPVIVPAAKPTLSLKLSGTIIEPGRSLAVLATPDGKTQLKPVGAEVGGVKILQIQPGVVTVLFQGETLELRAATKEGRP